MGRGCGSRTACSLGGPQGRQSLATAVPRCRYEPYDGADYSRAKQHDSRYEQSWWHFASAPFGLVSICLPGPQRAPPHYRVLHAPHELTRLA